MRDISLLHPLVQKKHKQLTDLAKAEGIEFLTVSTLRIKAEQNNEWAKGRTTSGNIVTNVRYPYSFHNHGVAFDIVPLNNGKSNWNDHSKFDKLGELGKSIGLEWGGDWKYFPDKPHFQLTQGRSIYEFIGGFELEMEMTEQERKHLKENEKILDKRLTKAWEEIKEANAAKEYVAQLKGIPFTPYLIVDSRDL